MTPRNHSAAGYRATANQKQHSNFTSYEAIEQFRNDAFNFGVILPDNIIGDGKLHRSKDEKGKLNIAYILHLDGLPAGYFEDFKLGVKEKWKLSGVTVSLSDTEREAFKTAAKIRDVEKLAAHEAAAIKAAYIWEHSTPAPHTHPYLKRKNIQPYHARANQYGSLVLPLFNSLGKLTSLQFITPNGDKSFLKDGVKRGSFSEIEGFRDLYLVCEGFATGASLHLNSGSTVIIAYDAGNLEIVALSLLAQNPKIHMMICADNDPSGVGQRKARAAALAVGCSMIIPPQQGDFNDLLGGAK